jgi:hypothetical protein
MPQSAIQAYLKHLPALQSEWNWMLANASAFPHLENERRAEMIEQWQTEMGARDSAPIHKLTTKQRRAVLQIEATKLAMLGIGTQIVPVASDGTHSK